MFRINTTKTYGVQVWYVERKFLGNWNRCSTNYMRKVEAVERMEAMSK
jgi:hypothetical protein